MMQALPKYLLALTTACLISTFRCSENACFCQLKGEIDDCSCSVENVDTFNNLRVYPILKSLSEKDYFRYFLVNLNRKCPYWNENFECVLRDCHVKPCERDQLPEGLKVKTNHNHHEARNHEKDKYSDETQATPGCESDDLDEELGYLNKTISKKSHEAFETWKKHDEAQNTFCELDDEDSEDMEYVDLLLNPERFTGYKGQSAQKIWNSIYNENCFKPQPGFSFLNQPSSESKMRDKWGLCLEKRVFFRMISGLHTSINVHLIYKHFTPGALGTSGTWGPNVEMFKKRFGPEHTGGEGPQRLKNLYFAYLVELRALSKIAPYLKDEVFYTGNEEEDAEAKNAVANLLNVIKTFPDHFDESKLFKGDQNEAEKLKEEFRLKFLNISRIMDCVGCDKCRLWGKLQTQGMGTALKILFSGEDIRPGSTLTAESKKKFQLRRTEIVSLINAFARLSSSIFAVGEFRNMIR